MANQKVALAWAGVLASIHPLVAGKVVVASESSLVQVDKVLVVVASALLQVVVVEDTKAVVEVAGMKFVVVPDENNNNNMKIIKLNH